MNYKLAKQLKCTKCKKQVRGKNGFLCERCNKKRHREHYLKNRAKYILKAEMWRERNPERSKKHRRDSNRRLRQKALDAYGRTCACCGETEEKFLSIDHIKGGGGKHRRQIGSSHIYSWLKKNNYPKGFQTLCHNCNMAKGFYGKCPHQEK